MKDIKNYIWVIILISGIVLLISVFTPVTYKIQPGYQSYTWLWGFRYYNIGGIDSSLYFWFLSESSYFNLPQGSIDIIIAVTIFIGALKLIITGYGFRTGINKIKYEERKLIRIGALMVIAPIIYVISKIIFGNLTLLFLGAEGFYVLWVGAGASNPGFAFFGPFIGGALVFISVIAIKKIRSTPKTPVVAKIGRLNFCPECGKKILSKENKFCNHCGFEMKHKNEVSNT